MSYTVNSLALYIVDRTLTDKGRLKSTGHRKEVFRPRSTRTIKNRIQQSLKDGKFSDAVNIAAFSYSSKPIADDFAISVLATAEAITLARQVNWRKITEDLVSAGISIAERKLNSRVNRKRLLIVFESIARSVERARKEESARDE